VLDEPDPERAWQLPCHGDVPHPGQATESVPDLPNINRKYILISILRKHS